MKEMHMFAGVNTPGGFVSRFEHILPDKPGVRKIYIKGGPGMGKSTLMKKVVKRASDEGVPCEVFHCSSDPMSVDAVHIPSLSTAILDATAPHNSDPLYLGMGGEILDVSAFLQKEKLEADFAAVPKLVEAKKTAFEKGYRFLQAALPLLKQEESLYTPGTDFAGICREAERLADRVLGTGESATMEERRLFLSAIGPEGFVNYGDTVFGDTYAVAVTGKCGTSIFVRRFAELARRRGFSPIVFYCPMRPFEKAEHVYIPKLRFSLTSYSFYTRTAAKETLDLNPFISPMPEEDGETFALSLSLMQRASDAFGEAKAAHAALESIYVPAMDFEGLRAKTAMLLESIF